MVATESNGLSNGFIYQSVRDVLIYNGLPPAEYGKILMTIGSLTHLDDEQYAKAKLGQSSSTMLTGDDIDRRARRGSNTN